MTRYYCDVCHEEIKGWFEELEISQQGTGMERNQKKQTLHFHGECLSKLLKALDKEENEDSAK